MHADAPQLSLPFYADVGYWDLVHEVASALGRPIHEPYIIRRAPVTDLNKATLMLHPVPSRHLKGCLASDRHAGTLMRQEQAAEAAVVLAQHGAPDQAEHLRPL